MVFGIDLILQSKTACSILKPVGHMMCFVSFLCLAMPTIERYFSIFLPYKYEE